MNENRTRRCWIIDVDGTLALRGDRSPYDLTKVSEDKPNIPVVKLVQALAAGPNPPEILVVSGRGEESRDDTLAWLYRHKVPFNGLVLRPEGDQRPDQVVKKEILDHLLSQGFEVEGVMDDRNKVVDMWRDAGLTCLQVAPGDF